MADPELAPKRAGGVRGGCLCGAIEFEVVAPFKVVHNCHCSRCRRARGAAHTTNGFTSMEGVIFFKGDFLRVIFLKGDRIKDGCINGLM